MVRCVCSQFGSQRTEWHGFRKCVTSGRLEDTNQVAYDLRMNDGCLDSFSIFFRFEPLGWPFSSWRTRMLHFSGQFAVNVSSFFLVLIGLSNAFTIEKNHTFSANMRKLGVFVWCLRKWQRCSDDFIFFLSFFVIEPLNRSYFFIYIRRENGQLVIDWFWWTQKQLHNVQ